METFSVYIRQPHGGTSCITVQASSAASAVKQVKLMHMGCFLPGSRIVCAEKGSH